MLHHLLQASDLLVRRLAGLVFIYLALSRTVTLSRAFHPG